MDRQSKLTFGPELMGLTCNRRTFVSACASLPFTASPAASISRVKGPRVAITIDDFDLSDTPLLSGIARDVSIRDALSRHGIRAAGFVAGKNVVGERSAQVLSAWSQNGHIIGNHSFSHRYYSGKHPNEMMSDILACEQLLSGYDGFRKLFRFPYLAEGSTAEGRDALRLLLHDHGYMNGHVTIDTSDWYVDQKLRARLKLDVHANISPYRRYYLQHLWDRAIFYDGLAQTLFGHSLEHTILLHHNLTTALFLNDVLAMFRNRGWELINASEAFASAEFRLEPDSLPAGQSLIWAVAKARGGLDDKLRYPGEDAQYEAPQMNALGL